MPETEMIGFVAVIAALALVFVSLLRLIGMWITHRTIRRAVDKSPEQAAALIGKLSAPRERTGDDRIAFILIAIGIAMAVAPLIAVDDRGLVRAAMGASLFPLLVGAVLWLRYRAIERARLRDRPE
jgi:membrane associated rhomboid family serine protease